MTITLKVLACYLWYRFFSSLVAVQLYEMGKGSPAQFQRVAITVAVFALGIIFVWLV